MMGTARAHTQTHWWLEAPSGKRRRIWGDGILLGRSSRCDVVLSDRMASRSQALVLASAGGAKLVVLGRGATAVNGELVTRERALDHGDRISVPGLELMIAQEAGTPDSDEVTWGWVLQSGDGTMFGMTRTPFVIGGGSLDDVRVDRWPACALTFHAMGGTLTVEARVPIRVQETDLAPGERARIRPGSVIEYAGETIRVVAGGALGEVHTAPDTSGGAHLRLEFLPRGGRFTVRMSGTDHAAFLPDRRCDLLAVLLRPPAPYLAGELIPDEEVIRRVWPNRARTRSHLNVLLHRLRRDLSGAGIDGAALIARADGGGATRLVLPDNATIELA